jgi:FAS-associated factor 2
MDTLTQQEEQLVNEFVSITSYTREPYTAIPYLRSAEWNLERAILLHFEGNTTANEQLNENSRRNTTLSAVPGGFPGDNTLPQRPGSSGFLENVRQRLQTWGAQHGQYLPLSTSEVASASNLMTLSTRSKLIYMLQMLLYVPLVALQKVTVAAFLVISTLFPTLRRVTERYSHSRQGSRSEPKGVDPVQVARNFISDFNMFHRNDDKIDFFEGGYTTALYIAKRDARFLMVYIHSDENDDTKEFVENTLLDDKVLEFINGHNILVWGGNVLESEAYQVSNAIGASKYPFVGLLCLKSNTQETPEGTTSSAPTLSVVAKVQGLVSPEKLVDKFSSQVERLEPALISIRSERQQQELSRMIRQQQDQAYQTSLERDREIAEQRRQERVKEEKREQWLLWRSSNLLPEVEGNAKGEYARVAIRMSSGERVSRRFAKDAPVEEVYAYVELYEKGLLNSSSAVPKPEGFEYEFSFKLISPMPREELEPSLERQIKDEHILWPNGNLIVEINE